MRLTNTMRRLAATTAVTMAFGPLANAQGLFDSNAAAAGVLGGLSTQLEKVAPKSNASLAAGGFATALEGTLKVPSDKTRIVDYPPRANAELLRVIAVVPPKGFEAWPIPVCAEQNNKVLGTWNITAKGDVVPAPWTGAMVSETPTSSACKAFILTARADINQKVAEAQQTITPIQESR